MKTGSIFYVSVFLAVLLIVSIPFVTLAQQNSPAEAVANAERDAQKYADPGHWFLMGCILQGNPTKVDESIALPPTRLLGKSPEYIRVYAATFGEKVKKIRTNSVTAGRIVCCISYFSLLWLPVLLE